MFPSRPLSRIALAGLACGVSFSQTTTPPLAATSKTEPGLETAVNWKWWVAPPASKEWGMELPEALRPKNPDSNVPPKAVVVARPETYEVKKGDAIARIAKQFDMSADQLKRFNGLTNDLIKIGQVLRIPTEEELLAMAPPPPPPKKEAKNAAEPAPELDYLAQQELDNVRAQVFLDREMFSPGIIDGKAGATFLKIREVYQQTHADAADPERLKLKAEAAFKNPYTHYLLRAEDFKFIRPPAPKPAPTGKKPAKAVKSPTPPPPPPTIDELVSADFLAYRNAWEFVAERFHCDEIFLRHLNPNLKDEPEVGSDFKVPDVAPFEIEKINEAPLQPAADPDNPVLAAVVSVSRLEISRGGKLVAVMPLASARPGLRGRGSWTLLDAIASPRMATKREPREAPKETPGQAAAAPAVKTSQPLEKEQYLAPGPNNPAGVIWIHLAKSGGTDPLPYGLHGTSIPAKMTSLQGIGGFRLTNWDIARAVRLIPAGTALQWKTR